MTQAAKLQMITDLLGGQPIYDEDENIVGTTAKLITIEQAIKLLVTPDEIESEK